MQSASFFTIDHFFCHSSIYNEILSVDETGFFTKKKSYHFGNILYLSDAPARVLEMIAFRQLIVMFHFNPTGANTINARLAGQGLPTKRVSKLRYLLSMLRTLLRQVRTSMPAWMRCSQWKILRSTGICQTSPYKKCC